MANNGPNTNLSQFFFTYDACSFLDRKNTIFGKIVGKTIFNLLAMEHLDTDGEDRPILRPRIIGVKVVVNPFEDVVVREIKREI
jgi:peptidyl-prolyl cis-trans isomerase SDCCAG10